MDRQDPRGSVGSHQGSTLSPTRPGTRQCCDITPGTGRDWRGCRHCGTHSSAAGGGSRGPGRCHTEPGGKHVVVFDRGRSPSTTAPRSGSGRRRSMGAVWSVPHRSRGTLPIGCDSGATFCSMQRSRLWEPRPSCRTPDASREWRTRLWSRRPRRHCARRCWTPRRGWPRRRRTSGGCTRRWRCAWPRSSPFAARCSRLARTLGACRRTQRLDLLLLGRPDGEEATWIAPSPLFVALSSKS